MITNPLKKSFYLVLLLGMAVLWMASCTSDEWGDRGMQTDPNRLTLNLQLGSVPVLTRATEAGEGTLNENVVGTADIFLFDAENGALAHYERITEEFTSTGSVQLALYKEEVRGHTYDVYVVANYPDEDLASVQTLDELKEKTCTTSFRFAANEGTGGYEKSFLMDGVAKDVSGTAWADGTNPTIDLARAAAKIRVTIHYGTAEDGTEYRENSSPEKKMINYATTTTLLAEGDVLTTSEERGLQSMSTYLPITGESVGEEQLYRAVFYSYANSWSFDPESSQVDLDNESYILLNIPVNTYKDDVLKAEILKNYYRVPLNNGQQLERNHLYDISVTVAAKGSATETSPVELIGKLEVQDWKPESITVGGDDAQFLEVNKENIRMTNIEEDATLIFYSSSPLTSVEVLNVKYTNKYGVEKDIPDEDGDEDEDDTDGEDYPNDDYTPIVVFDETVTEGTITITSKLLINVPKTFTLRLTNEDGLTKEVQVEQYPLEYITSTQGWYATRTDITPWEWYDSDNTDYRYNFTVRGNFGAKVVRSVDSNGKSVIYKFRWSRTSNEQPDYWLAGWGYTNGDERKPYFSDEQDFTNARMYHVHVTAASLDYKLGYPQRDANGYTSDISGNERIVSPSFMIASQLGNSDRTDGSGNSTIVPEDGSESFENQMNDAKKHCANYVEATNVVFNGEIPDYDSPDIRRYSDWRLPTRAELEVIVTYQDIGHSAIDEVLNSEYYWCSDGYFQNTTEKTTNAGIRIRCVRDVIPGDDEYVVPD